MNLQDINVGAFGLTNLALQLFFINKLFQLFFEVTKGDVRLEIFPLFELFLAEIALVIRALLGGDYQLLGNMK